mgnify:CR=1 FL=1
MYGNPRIMDLEEAVNFVLETKKMYTGWKLNMIIKIGQYDTLPPKNLYEYTFITSENIRFIWRNTNI